MISYKSKREINDTIERFINILDTLLITCEKPSDVRVGGPGLLDSLAYNSLVTYFVERYDEG